MKYLLACLILTLSFSAKAQSPVPDSVIRELSRLTCECITLLKVDELYISKGFDRLTTCVSGTLDIMSNEGLVKKEWMTDQSIYRRMITALQKQLSIDCPVFKTLIATTAPEPLAEANDRLFLEAGTMTKRGFTESVHNGSMHRWNTKMERTDKIQIVFDIRFEFKTEKDADAYLFLKSKEMREGGAATKLSLGQFGAEQSAVYREDPKLTEAFGDLDMAHYNFLFRVKNVVAKVFVSATKAATYEEALAFAKEAIEQIKGVVMAKNEK
jgi:hypothetical protein